MLFFSFGTVLAGAPAKEPASSATKEAAPREKLSVTHHTLLINNRAFDNTATTGRLPVVNNSGKHEADIFFIAYTKEEVQDLALLSLIFYFLWRNGEPMRHLGWTLKKIWKDIGIGIVVAAMFQLK